MQGPRDGAQRTQDIPQAFKSTREEEVKEQSQACLRRHRGQPEVLPVVKAGINYEQQVSTQVLTNSK